MDPQIVGVFGAALLLSGGLVLLMLAWRARRSRGVERLRRVMQDDSTDHDDPSLAATWSALVRAGEAIGHNTSLYDLLRERLERAGWVLRPTEFLLVLTGATIGGAFLGWRTNGLPAALLVAILLPALTWLFLASRADRYSARCDEQLPDALGQMAAAMRAGHSMQQAMEGVADHAAEPLAGEFSRVLADTKVGRPLDDAMLAMGERVGSTDLRWAIRAMLIQRRTGGKLADILEVLANFMRDRTEVRREVQALTAEGRISAIILMALPFVILAAVLVVSPAYLAPLFTTQLGRLLLITAAVAMGVAWLLMRNIIKVEV